jgi:hypothetical protein
MSRKRPDWPGSIETELYKVLFDNLPNHRSETKSGSLATSRIAIELAISNQAVWSWFEREKISLHCLKRLTALKGSTLTLAAAIDAMRD